MYVGVACGMTVLGEMRVRHMGRGRGLSGVSDAIHVNVPVHWKWNQARKGERQWMTGQVSAPVVKSRIRSKSCGTSTHIDSISAFVYPHAVYNRVETSAKNSLVWCGVMVA